MVRIVYVIFGFLGLILGMVGVILPILPTVPFLLLAFVCFAKGSSRLSNWFVNTKLYKKHLESYVLGLGMTKQTKTKMIVLLTLVMGFAFYMMSDVIVGRILLGVVWVCHLYFVFFHVETKTESKDNIKYYNDVKSVGK